MALVTRIDSGYAKMKQQVVRALRQIRADRTREQEIDRLSSKEGQILAF